MNLIEAKDIHKYFEKREVVKGISLSIKKGEIVALIGTNGAGKSTTLSMILGILDPSSGTILRWREDYKAHIGVQLQATPFFEGYNTEDNLKLFASLYHITLSEQQIEETLISCNLIPVRKTLASRLSGGQQKRLAIAVTTLHNPELVILDEPTAGLDPRARHNIRTLIDHLSSQGATIVFSSHDMEEVSRITDHVILMHEGTIIADGRPEQLLKEYGQTNLDELYLSLTNTHESWEEQ